MNATLMDTRASATDEIHDPVFPTYEEVEARLRAEYARHTPEQREIHGDMPDEGTILGEWARKLCSHHTREQRRAGALRLMNRIRVEAAQSHDHADHTAVRR